MNNRKQQIVRHFDSLAETRDNWIEVNKGYYADDYRYMQFLVPQSMRVLDLGCGTGRLLASLRPSRGVGVDISPRMIERAQSQHPGLEFLVADIESVNDLEEIEGPFDYIILSDTIGCLEDCQTTLRQLHRFCTPETRIVVCYYSRLWEPLLGIAERWGLKMRNVEQNWLATDDIANIMHLADFQMVRREWRQLVPRSLLGLGPLINRYIATLPGIRRLCLRNYVVSRPVGLTSRREMSVSVVIPARNERGNIESAITRLPRFGTSQEVVFVEGGSADGTFEEMLRVQAAYPELSIQVLKQDGKGKGDAVRKGFAAANGDVLMILDADLTMPPEDLPKFYDVLAEDKAEFVNGSRLVYPMESEAMRFLNHVANIAFSMIFTWLLNQRYTDTLCGTKVLRREHYLKIESGRTYFGDFDPFGDFDLIFGAAKLNLKVIEIPIRYAARTYGETQISRFTHGWLLLRMVAFAYRKLKAL